MRGRTGSKSSVSNKTESYNGSSWTETGDLNTAKVWFASAGVDNESALGFGGYNGSRQTVQQNLGMVHHGLKLRFKYWKMVIRGFRNFHSALGFGGYDPSDAVKVQNYGMVQVGLRLMQI